MSILIKGMKKPDRCVDCPFMISRDNDDCILQSDTENESFMNWDDMRANCPLVELPEKQGGWMLNNEIDRIECAIRHINTAVDVDEWARIIAVKAMRYMIAKSIEEGMENDQRRSD